MTGNRLLKITTTALIAALFFAVAFLCSCGFSNPGDSLGGGGSMDSLPVKSEDVLSSEARNVAGEIEKAVYTTADEVKANATHLDNKTVSSPGSYYIEGDEFYGKKISVEADGVTLYLLDAMLSKDDKVIESKEYPLTLTLVGSNEIVEHTAEKNAVDVAGDLVINGPGSLAISSLKNGVKANSINITEASLSVDAKKDALHAEIDSYDDAQEEPEFSYEEGGFVHIDDATIDLVSGDDGIQADTFVFVEGSGTSIDIETNGGAPKTVTESSSDAADGKGIKTGTIDWGKDDAEIESEDYLILIDDGNININSNDDAVHSNGTIVINGGTFDIETGDDGIHGDDLLLILGGEIDISKCYEGIESMKVEISGGDISVSSADDGINAANSDAKESMRSDPECHVIISGGEVYVDASGDGIDSNGTMLIEGGDVYVSGSTSGADAALDSNGGIAVNGGRLFACGALGMVETPSSDSAQFVVSYANGSKISAGTKLYLLDSNDDILMEYEIPKSCQSVILSCPELEKGKSYTIYGGDTKLSTFTISSAITSAGSSKSTSNGGGTPPGVTSQPGGGLGNMS